MQSLTIRWGRDINSGKNVLNKNYIYKIVHAYREIQKFVFGSVQMADDKNVISS